MQVTSINQVSETLPDDDSEPMEFEDLTNVTGPAKIDHVSAKNCQFLACLLYHNLITIYTTATKSSSLLQNLMGFLLQLTEMG